MSAADLSIIAPIRSASMSEGSVEDEGSSEPTTAPRRTRLALVLAVLVVAAFGAGGYALGRGSGEDLEQARAEGVSAGEARGSEAGKRRGYAAGRKAGRQKGFEQSYPSSYRKAYAQAFEDANLRPPENVTVKDGS